MNPALINLVLGLGMGIFADHWKPLAFLAPKPPTAQLTALQADLEKAKADAQARENTLVAAKAKEQADLLAQLKAAQQMQSGAVVAFSRVPPMSQTPEFALGSSLLVRSNVRLAAAIGKLPEDMQAEILSIVDQALSTVQAERDAAQAALAKKDAEYQMVTADRDAVKAQIPALQKQADDAVAKVTVTEAKVTEKTNEVKAVADKLDAKAREAGSLLGSLDSVWHWILGIGCAYVFLAYILPGITGVMKSGPLKNALRHVSGFVLNPIHHADAVATINELKSTQPKT